MDKIFWQSIKVQKSNQVYLSVVKETPQKSIMDKKQVYRNSYKDKYGKLHSLYVRYRKFIIINPSFLTLWAKLEECVEQGGLHPCP